ncbi:MAG: ATP-binding protein [Methanobrevibacter sp.]|uniref:ATP-binding protein n=1 Tax=Methanobrevibacter sp. TaxID=66852 RepID=UPI0025F691C6|nr:ATP-binding protein [Methanobrevibacter sp.]MBR0271753.1 ATP-binding protein [Methanobrevibacter sp.]
MSFLKITPNIDNLYQLNEFIHSIILKEDFQVDLIVEEVFVNIVNYSHSDFIQVNVDYTDKTLKMEFIDNGVEFNPLLKEDVNPPDNIDDAEVGGLGIHITKELSDEISYEYVNGENHLKIIKIVE